MFMGGFVKSTFSPTVKHLIMHFPEILECELSVVLGDTVNAQEFEPLKCVHELTYPKHLLVLV